MKNQPIEEAPETEQKFRLSALLLIPVLLLAGMFLSKKGIKRRTKERYQTPLFI